MAQYHLSLSAARQVVTNAQQLANHPGRPACKDDLYQVIHALGALQIDTINIVARSPYLALFSRLGVYNPAWLDELLVEGKIFEYWAHAACFLPDPDFPLHRRLCLEGHRGWFSDAWYQADRMTVDGVLDHIRASGPARSVDFERADGKKGTWWDWKIEKQALEFWFACGELMVARRQNFQRVYDLRERVRPDWDDRQAPPLEEVERELTLKAVRAMGIVRSGWVWDYFRRSKKMTPQLVRELASDGLLLEVAVEGWNEPAYAHPESRPLLAEAESGRLHATRTTLLSPFDSLVWDRDRALELFGFNYSIECYLPVSKRKYGYFLLPILHQGELIGRLDAKAHRKEKLFEVKSLYLEPSVRVDEELANALAGALRECGEWHGASEVVVKRSEPEIFTGLLNSRLTD
jgi:uncharacterized protein